jgi:DNA (cytosine-5)-methyltransferase 1
MKHGSLFSGIGGFDLAAEWMGWENVFHCEINEFGRKVLKYYWPDAESFTDITKTDFTKYNGAIDIISGGFPCQPYSMAGKRKGKEDERHLWPEMLRAIREIRPSWVVGENVFGLVNWSGGLVFHEVQVDLEAEGYEVWPYVLPACAVNAPHRRDRIWFVAHSRYNSERNAGNSSTDEGSKLTTLHTERQSRECKAVFNCGFCDLPGITANTDNAGNPTLRSGINGNEQKESCEREQPQYECSGHGNEGITTDSNSDGQHRSNSEHEKQPGKRRLNVTECIEPVCEHAADGVGSRRIQNNEQQQAREFKYACAGWDEFPTQSPVCNRNDGFPGELVGLSFPKWRAESIKAMGNAIVPQVVYEIFKAIEETEIFFLD